ncbi:MAG TPA: nickel pincer cofactor biosynthesis protein LarB [Deltaproteobacteria bacterium]|nr:nickel pincer cofactor biosynthesis protein LarB [Deltaproteobacteria bacterium]HPR55994.1 nickel pincer cofactor biosynthesis protein LarB [Deltaproteobacteria bacterium]
MKNLLDAYRRGELSAEEVQERLMRMLYEEGEDFLLDLHRGHRIGFPEVIFAEGKSMEQVLAITKTLFERNGLVFVSSVDREKEELLRKQFATAEVKKAGRLMLIGRSGVKARKAEGCVGIVTAGTADVPYAQECALMLEEMGYDLITAFDIGASGMHRPLLGLKKAKDADLLIVFAGMDGVLPTLIASLTDLPVIAVPTPVGYGHGGQGEAALSTMLQCCVPGVLVLNIGNSVGAAAAAVRILKSFRRREGGEAR